MKTGQLHFGLCLCAFYLACLAIVTSAPALVGAVLVSSCLLVPAILDVTERGGKVSTFFFRGNNRRITYLCEILLAVGFYAHHGLKAAAISVLWVVPPALLCHLASYSMYDYLDRLRLPYIVRKHRHRYVERIKKVPKRRSHVGRYYWTGELFLCVPAHLYALDRPMGPLWLWVASAASVPVGLAAFDLYVYLRIDGRVRTGVYRKQVRNALFELQPEIVFHFGSKAACFYQVTMWLDAVKALGRNVLLVVRNADAVGHAKNCGLPVLFVQTEADVEYLMPSTVRLALFTGNTGNNLVVIRLAHLRSAFLGHGDSDKISSSNHVTKVFDYVLVAGPAAIDRYKRAKVRLKDSAFKVVGRPPLDVITRCTEPLSAERLRILYAPTWEGWSDSTNYSSLSCARQQIESLLERYPEATVIFRPHPYTGFHIKHHLAYQTAIVALLRSHSSRHRICIGHEYSIYDCFNQSDILVTDISSVVSDYLASLKPIILSRPQSIAPEAFVEEFGVAAACYLNAGERDSLVEQVASVLDGDPLRDARHRMAEHVLGDLTISHTELFRRTVQGLLKKARKDFPVVLGDDEEALRAKLARRNRKAMLAKRSNDGRASTAGVLWVHAPWGLFARDYFQAGDIVVVQILKKETSLSVGETLRIRSAEFDRKRTCYKLQLDVEPPPSLGKKAVKFQVFSGRDGALLLGKWKTPPVPFSPAETVFLDAGPIPVAPEASAERETLQDLAELQPASRLEEVENNGGTGESTG